MAALNLWTSSGPRKLASALQILPQLGAIEVVPGSDASELIHLTTPAAAKRCASADDNRLCQQGRGVLSVTRGRARTPVGRGLLRQRPTSEMPRPCAPGCGPMVWMRERLGGS